MAVKASGKLVVGQKGSEGRRLADFPDTLRVEEVARVLRIGRNTAYTAVRSGQIPSVRVGGRLLVPKTALERLLSGAGARG